MSQIFAQIKEGQEEKQTGGNGKEVLEALMETILENMDLSDGMDIEKNLRMMGDAGKQRKRRTHGERYNREGFLEYEGRFKQ